MRRPARDLVGPVSARADETAICQLTTQAYAVRFLDALRQDATPAIRQHDGTDLID